MLAPFGRIRLALQEDGKRGVGGKLQHSEFSIQHCR
jgi:hypothetical protein